jgi:hypothetical protein
MRIFVVEYASIIAEGPHLKMREVLLPMMGVPEWLLRHFSTET